MAHPKKHHSKVAEKLRGLAHKGGEELQRSYPHAAKAVYALGDAVKVLSDHHRSFDSEMSHLFGGHGDYTGESIVAIARKAQHKRKRRKPTKAASKTTHKKRKSSKKRGSKK